METIPTPLYVRYAPMYVDRRLKSVLTYLSTKQELTPKEICSIAVAEMCHALLEDLNTSNPEITELKALCRQISYEYQKIEEPECPIEECIE